MDKDEQIFVVVPNKKGDKEIWLTEGMILNALERTYPAWLGGKIDVKKIRVRERKVIGIDGNKVSYHKQV